MKKTIALIAASFFGASLIVGAQSGTIQRALTTVPFMQIIGAGQVKNSPAGCTSVTGADNGAYFYVCNGSVNVNSAQLNFLSGGVSNGGNGFKLAKYARLTAQNAAAASVAAFTVGASDATFDVSCNVNVTTATSHSFGCSVAFTDDNNISRTHFFMFQTPSGNTPVSNAAIVNTNGTVDYAGYPIHIRAKASTTITIATSGTFTTVTYNVEGKITQEA